jgi:hypothetical protein
MSNKEWISGYITSKLKQDVICQSELEDRTVSATVKRALELYLERAKEQTSGNPKQTRVR